MAELNGSDSSEGEFDEPIIEKHDEVFDPKREKNYEKVKEMIDRLAEGKFSWKTVKNEAGEGVKQPINHRVTSIFVDEANKVDLEGEYPIKERFLPGFKEVNGQKSSSTDSAFTPLQQSLLGPLSANMDIIYTNEQMENEADLRNLYCLHSLQLIMNARSKILKNSQTLAIAREEKGRKAVIDAAELVEKDQGFTRPRVLIIVPFRNSAKDVIEVMSKLWKNRLAGGADCQVENYKRFMDEFSRDEDEDPVDLSRDKRPADFHHLFRDNIDDCFRVGIKFTRKSMKLYSDFYSADIILASPLGLRLIIDGAEKNLKCGDWDFLSSIELAVLDQADVINMQNWENIEKIYEHLNKIPKKAHNCDFSRVKSVYLDGNGKAVRQNIIASKLVFPELKALLNDNEVFGNCAGQWKFQVKGAESLSLMKRVAQAAAQPSFYMLPVKSTKATPMDIVTARFNYFISYFLPAYSQLGGVCVFVPSYYDFCQLRAHLTKHDYSFAHISEYTNNADISRARSRFFNGHVKLLLVTDRFYFFRRYRIRGLKHLVFYGLPEYPEFVAEWLEMVDVNSASTMTADVVKANKQAAKKSKTAVEVEIGEVPVLVSPLDFLKLERVIGTTKTRQVLELE